MEGAEEKALEALKRDFKKARVRVPSVVRLEQRFTDQTLGKLWFLSLKPLRNLNFALGKNSYVLLHLAIHLASFLEKACDCYSQGSVSFLNLCRPEAESLVSKVGKVSKAT